jgi:MinD superfamily P-loop ATPase
VNKYDLNLKMTTIIEESCYQRGVPVIGRIPFDKTVVQALVEGNTVVDYAQCVSGDAIQRIWEELKD